jgi:uncharacterized small protein (DUF1192 family)
MDEEDAPRMHRLVEQPVLDSFGVAELHAYIAALQGEVARAEAMIARKASHRGAAEAVFGKR